MNRVKSEHLLQLFTQLDYTICCIRIQILTYRNKNNIPNDPTSFNEITDFFFKKE